MTKKLPIKYHNYWECPECQAENRYTREINASIPPSIWYRCPCGYLHLEHLKEW